MRKFFINSKFRHRHKILGTLQERLDSENHPNAMPEDIELTFSTLVDKSGLSESEVLKQIDYLRSEEEIDINERNNYSMSYVILRKGTVAYFDDKYLRLGWKNFLENVYDIVKIISAIVLLAIATSTYISNIIDTKKNKKEIQKMQDDIKAIKDSVNHTSKKP